ncbi:MAG: hypothetical protein E4G99_01985 [Anaerolineales bacterium]|nr:MAG: hypothetical protein E4G99_01985 [Anaerolineales bacterium]
MTSEERRWVWIYGIALALACSLPYVIGFAIAGTDWQFTGFVFGVEDGNSYIAKMLAGSSGEWLFRTPYTTMQQQGELAFLPYLLLGKLAAPPALHLQLTVLFHLFRWCVTPFAVFAIYRFSSLYIQRLSYRRWVTILATLGGGLGWTLPLLGKTAWMGSLPLDFISPETFGFLAFLGLPHLVLARGLILMAIQRYVESGRDGTRTWRPGVLLLVLTLVQSLSTLSAIAVIFFHQALLLLGSPQRRKEWRQTWMPAALRSVLPSLPLILYYVYRFSSDPFLQAWTDQNRINSPHPFHYLLAYGLIIVPVLYAITKQPWLDRPVWILPVAWVMALPLLAYFPHNLQRRLVEGVWVALLILAAHGFEQWKAGARLKLSVRYALTAMAHLSAISLFIGSFQVASQPALPAFVPGEQATAFQWLADHVAPGSVVLAAYATSNALPAWAPVVVPIGHGPESVGLEALKPQVEAVYGSLIQPAARLDWLRFAQVDYVFYGVHERALGTWDPGQETFLTNVYQSETIAIYEVDHAEG